MDEASPRGETNPIARLMAMAFRTLIDDLHVRLERRGWNDVKPSYGFVLLAVREQEQSINAIADLMGVSKQAASKLVHNMEAAGYVRCYPSVDDARSKLVRLTRQGGRVLRCVEGIYRELEADWASVIGSRRLEAIRADLERVLKAGNDGELPAIKPTW